MFLRVEYRKKSLAKKDADRCFGDDSRRIWLNHSQGLFFNFELQVLSGAFDSLQNRTCKLFWFSYDFQKHLISKCIVNSSFITHSCSFFFVQTQ